MALVAGIFGAIHFSYITGNYLSEHLDWDERNMSIIAFIITLILIIIIVNLAGKILTKVANFAMLGSLNKIAGGIFGVLKVAILLGAAFIFFDRMDNTFGLIKEETKQESVLYQPIKDIGALIFDTVLKSEVLPKESTEEPVTI